MGAVPILTFRNLDSMSCDLYCHTILLPCAKFHWNRTRALLFQHALKYSY